MTPNTDMQDQQLIQLYEKGNDSAFDILLERYQQKIYVYVIQMVRDTDVAEDIFQETFMKAIVTIRQGKYTENGKFSAWLYRIARNLCLDHIRRQGHTNDIYDEELPRLAQNNSELLDIDIESKMVHTQVMEDLRHLVERLPDTQQEIVQLRFYQGLSFREIADLLDISINTALGRMRYALINLRRLIQKHQLDLAV